MSGLIKISVSTFVKLYKIISRLSKEHLITAQQQQQQAELMPSVFKQLYIMCSLNIP